MGGDIEREKMQYLDMKETDSKPTHRLRELRESRGFSQEKAGELFGMSTSGYQKIEQGSRGLKANVIAKACEIYGVDEAAILGRNNAKLYSIAPNLSKNFALQINRELLTSIIVKIDEVRKLRNVALGGREPEQYSEFVADLYELAMSKGGDFNSVSYFFDLASYEDDHNNN